MERKSGLDEHRLSSYSLVFVEQTYEDQFRENQRSTDVFFVRYLALVIFAVELMYSVKDLNWSPHLPAIVVFFRAFYLTPLMLSIFLFTFYTPFKRSVQRVSWASILMVISLIFGQYFMTALNPDVESSFAKTLPLLLFSTYLFTGVKFRHITIITPLVLISFVIVMIFYSNIDNATKINDSLLVIMNICLAVFFKYILEMSQRRNFLRSLAIKQSQEQLKSSLNTERGLSTLRKNLIGILAHDIRSPLANVRSIIKLSGDKSISDEDRDELFDKLEKRITIIDDGVNDLLTWVKSQEEGLEVEAVEVQPKIIIDEVIAQYYEQRESKNIVTEVSIEEGIKVLTDLGILKAVLRNLYSNALKFSYPEGRVILMAKRSNTGITFTIKDFGVGMSADVVEGISSQFYSTPGTGDERGTGLGLNICYTLLEKLNSSLKLESVLDAGTTASFHLENSEIST